MVGSSPRLVEFTCFKLSTKNTLYIVHFSLPISHFKQIDGIYLVFSWQRQTLALEVLKLDAHLLTSPLIPRPPN